MARQRACEVRQRGGRLAEHCFDRARIARSERLPCPLGELELLRFYRWPGFFQLLQLSDRKRRDVSVDDDHRESFPFGFSAAEEIEQLNELELIVEIVLEPEHHLIEKVEVLDHAITLAEIAADVREIVPVVPGDE